MYVLFSLALYYIEFNGIINIVFYYYNVVIHLTYLNY